MMPRKVSLKNKAPWQVQAVGPEHHWGNQPQGDEGSRLSPLSALLPRATGPGGRCLAWHSLGLPSSFGWQCFRGLCVWARGVGQRACLCRAPWGHVTSVARCGVLATCRNAACRHCQCGHAQAGARGGAADLPVQNSARSCDLRRKVRRACHLPWGHLVRVQATWIHLLAKVGQRACPSRPVGAMGPPSRRRGVLATRGGVEDARSRQGSPATCLRVWPQGLKRRRWPG